MDKEKDTLEKIKKTAVGAAAGTIAAASLTVGALFGAPAELLNVENDADQPDSQAIVLSVDEYDRAAASARAKPVGIKATLRAFLLRQNAAVRALVLMPLWAAGKFALWGLSLLWTALSPFWQVLLGVLLNALLLFGVIAFFYKLLFPHRRIKDLFQKKTLPWLLLGTAALATTDALLKAFVPEYAPVSIGVKAGIGFLVLLLLCCKIFGRKQVPAKAAATGY